MKLRELEKIIMDKVCIYKESSDSDGYENLYLGMLNTAPSELLEQKIGVMGAKRKGLIDIEIR